MNTNGIKELVEALMKMNGENVWINIAHDFYGNQNLKCAFQLLSDEERLGVLVGEQEIYIEKKKIENFEAKDDLVYFADDLMCIKIRKM